MTVSKFWNQAFIAALTRLPAEQAKIEADKDLAIAIEHWQSVMKDKGAVVPEWVLYADRRMEDIRIPQGE